MTEVKHRHLLIACDCGTVLYDCGCRLRLVETREAACDVCRAAAQDLVRWRRSLCDGAYEAESGS